MDRLKIVECDRTNFFCGYSSTQQTLDEWKPDAIIAINDIMALGAERAVRERGLRIPDDVSVCGYDDVIFSRIAEVPLTTVRQDIKGICEKTVHVLFSRITGKRTATAVHWIQPELVVRTSAGPRAGTLKGSGKKQHEKI